MFSSPWIGQQAWYVPGMGIVLAGAIVYLIGLTVSTFLGQWAWRTFDRMLDRLPVLGQLYATLKQVLGYGEGSEGLFQQVVLVPGRDVDCVELGLVTNDLVDDQDRRMLTVFVPAAPTPTSGRLIVIEADRVHPVAMPVNEALKALVSVGKTSLTEETVRHDPRLARATDDQPPT